MNEFGLRMKRKVLLCIAIGMGLTLSFCETSEAGAIMALEEESPDSKHVVRKMIGGIVIRIARDPKNQNVSLSIRETWIGIDGSPLCNSPAGRILDVESVAEVFREDPKRLNSALVVMENPSDPAPGDLKAGQCVSVAPDDIDRVQAAMRSNIEIGSVPAVKKTRDRIHLGVVGLWVASPSRKIPDDLSRPESGHLPKMGASLRPSRTNDAPFLRRPA